MDLSERGKEVGEAMQDEQAGGADRASRRQEPQLLGADLIIPLLGIALAAYYFMSVWELPWIARSHGLLVGSALVVLTLALIVRHVMWMASGKGRFALGESLRRLDLLNRRRVGLVVLMAGYVLAISSLGFLLTTFVFLILAMLLLGVRSPRPLLGVSITAAIVAHLFFVTFLQLRLPQGPLERLLGGLF